MRIFTLLLSLLSFFIANSQTASLTGQLQDANADAVVFANVALYQAADSSLYKVETTDESGVLRMQGIEAGRYFLKASFVGLKEFQLDDIELQEGQQLDLGVLVLEPMAIDLAEATVKASRSIVEVKPDRTVFNVSGTINSTGSDAISLLRKAPGVTVDNNDNINVLGRSGVLVYVDGKRLPLTGEDLSNYLNNLQADQIDRIEIISNPGAQYEAEGNAGIIDIRLKKDDRQGANGTVGGTWSQGRYGRYNLNASGNFRNKNMNAFGTAGMAEGTSFNEMFFKNTQNGLFLNETNDMRNEWQNANLRLGADFFVAKQHTLGFQLSVNHNERENTSINRNQIATVAQPDLVDSILLARNFSTDLRDQQTYNVNYRFDNGKGRSLNVDLDYGKYNNDATRLQPNQYFDASEEQLLTEVVNSFNTPTEIDIYTAKVDFEDKLWGGRIGAGSKISRVVSENTFLFFDVVNGSETRNDRSSNLFDYEETVYAGYFNYSRRLNERWGISAGLRAEQTDATGNLQAFLPSLQEPPVEFNYLSWFPSAGVTWQFDKQNTVALNYGRRINRPDYNVLNPFNNQLSELSFEKGNPFLRPEIVNNLELGLTMAQRYNFKLAYSRTTDQITRLIAPDDEDPRAGFITWENLSEQTVWSFNVSAPFQFFEGWNMYVNASASHLDNQADYGGGAIVDLQAFTWSVYQQSVFQLPWQLTGEISGYFSGPGVWGGVFEYESNWSLDLGLQRKFLNEQLNVRLSMSDLFYQTGWDGQSSFNGLEVSDAGGRWDSRRFSISLNYSFGNQKVNSRKRKTGLEEEAGRIGG